MPVTNIKVKPYGPLMVEHRIIEKMIALIGKKLGIMGKKGMVDIHFIDVTAGFLRTYADKCHHGKEEAILFEKLQKKQLSDEHRKILKELLDDHVIARQAVRALLAARDRYVAGDRKAADEIKALLTKLASLYPAHIETEDKRFFIPVMKYFTEAEQQDMVQEFWEFDRKMIHEEYKDTVEHLADEIEK
jgi:hemerythrin-like domain-containing protein